jgi:phosphotransferase system enzyme I (PtsI)
MAGDAALAPLLLALGLEEFSLHPATLLEVRQAIRGSDLGALRARAGALLRARDRRRIEEWVRANAPARLEASSGRDHRVVAPG